MAGNNQRSNITGDGHQELQYLRFHNLALVPVGEAKGQFYYDTVTKLLGIFDGTWTYLPKTFLDLHDTTDTTYTAKAGFVPMVNNAETELELIDSELATFLILDDTPSTYVGQGGKLVRVNIAETALEFLSGSSSAIIGVTDGIFNLDGTAGVLTVSPYVAQTFGGFDSSVTPPSGITRLNWNGNFYATGFNVSSIATLKYVGTDASKNLVAMTDPDTFWKRTSTLIETRTSGDNFRITSNGVSIHGISTGNDAIFGSSSGGAGVSAYSSSTYAGQYTSSIASVNTVVPILNINRLTSGTPTNGIGGSLVFNIKSTSDSNLWPSGIFSNKWTDATFATRTASFEWWLTYLGTSGKKMELTGAGSLNTLRGQYHYHSQTLGADTAGDWRTYGNGTAFYTEYCTVGAATLGGGTWVMKHTIEI